MSKNLKEKIQILIRKYEYKKFQEVVNDSMVILKKNDNDFVWNLVGLSFQKLFNVERSIDCFENAININSKNFSAFNNLGLSYKYLKDYNKAEEYLIKSIEINPKYINALVNLGNIKNDTYFLQEAIDYYNRALKLDRNLPLVHLNISNVYRSINKIDLAKKHLNEATTIDNKFTIADQKLTSLEKYQENNPHIMKMINKLEKLDLDNNQKVHLYFGLNKVYRDLKNYEKSLFYLKISNQEQRKLINYNIQTHKFLSEKIKSYFSKIKYEKFVQKGKGRGYIFVLGMPRSGTTLVEKIISTHSKVSSISESNFIPEKIYNEIKKNYEEFEKFLKLDFDFLYKNFIKCFNTHNKIILDKTLTNFWYLGFIKIFFPEAKIIHVFRNPKDNCLSIYENLFDAPEGWNSDQNELAEYYFLYKDLMEFWNQYFKNSFINIKYEHLISNPETKIKELINSCNLDWEKNCLEFYKNDNPIKTVSFNQANKPIYKTSLKKYEIYENDLEDLFSNLN